jgi:NAD(P)-dependent dehydrogenase (short-subunit alcohol dehydrogenase family)
VSGRVALVTGAGRGIGRSTALALAARGDRVMAVARTESDLAAMASEAAGIEYLAASIVGAEACEEIVAETERRLGSVDILVLNAGIGSDSEEPIWAQPTAVWEETMRVNLDAPFHLCRATTGGMVERGFGRIVMVSSTAGHVGGPRMTAYCASKHGLDGLMRAVAQDVGPHGVTCNAVAPGWVRTPMAERSAQVDAERRGITVDAVWEERGASYPQGRVVEPDEVAGVIAFLASDAASGVNGEVVTVALGGVW